MMLVAPACRLYLITPPRIDDLCGFAATLEAALGGGDVAAVQLRLKDVDDADVVAAVAALGPCVRAAGAALILNDRPDLAAQLDCDGVHIGQEDLGYLAARRAVGPEVAVGVTCHDSLDLAFAAAEAGADYVAFGAFHPTSTKTVSTRADPELLEAWQSHMLIPCVAIGGITVETARDLARAGADFLAVSAGVWAHPAGAAVAVAAFNAQMADGVAARVNHSLEG